jgi:hypothetical protein
MSRKRTKGGVERPAFLGIDGIVLLVVVVVVVVGVGCGGR